MDQTDCYGAFPFEQIAVEVDRPFALAGTVLLASDTAVEKHAPSNPNTISRGTTASNAGLAALAGAGAGMFLWGHLTHNDQQRETGLLSGEAAIDAALDTEIIKYAVGRDRPFVGDGRGRFFQGGDSFPSFHASTSFAIASVIAHEYSGPLTQVLAYGVATGVDAARFAGRKHFMTDLVVGSALGWYIGRQVYRAHSRYSDADIAKFGRFSKDEGDTVRDPADMSSSFVALDSWIYPALERLQSLGYIQSGFLGMRPWTRMECARLLEEANLRLQDAEPNDDTERAQRIYADLAEEFTEETGRINGGSNVGIAVDSLYTRFTQISGLPCGTGYILDKLSSTIMGVPTDVASITSVDLPVMRRPARFHFTFVASTSTWHRSPLCRRERAGHRECRRTSSATRPRNAHSKSI